MEVEHVAVRAVRYIKGRGWTVIPVTNPDGQDWVPGTANIKAHYLYDDNYVGTCEGVPFDEATFFALERQSGDDQGNDCVLITIKGVRYPGYHLVPKHSLRWMNGRKLFKCE